MSIRSRIQDGAGTTIKPEVFDHRLRELEVQQSATNHISIAQLNGRTGVFTVRMNGGEFGLLANATFSLLSLTNNDPVNFLIIDRVYVQVYISTITLPDKNFVVAVDNRIPTNAAFKISKDNQSSTIMPAVNSFSLTTNTTSAPIAARNVPRIIPTLGDVEELIPPGSNGIELGKSQSISINAFNATGSTITTIGFNVFIRFMMVPPSALG